MARRGGGGIPIRRGGRVYLVGAGPGDPGLITVRGRDLLQRADVVVYDALASRELVDLAPPAAERIDAGKRPGGPRAAQDRLNRLLVARARRGDTVVRLKGGDPCLFGRGGEEAEALEAAGVPFEIVPGVTAALGAAAWAGIPLTHRRCASTVAFATGHTGPDRRPIDWRSLAGADTLVVYMGTRRLPAIVRQLIAAGVDARTPAALVEWATRPDQRVVEGALGTLPRLARQAGLVPPATLIVGPVVRLRRRLDWASRRPLAGRTVVVTRARGQAEEFSARLREAGARVIEAPAIAFEPPRSWAAADRALRRIATYGFVIFTSVNGVDRLFERLLDRGGDLRDLAGARLVAIGPATAAAIRARGLRVEGVPEDYRAEGLIRLIGQRAGRSGIRGMRILIPRATVARDLLPRALRARGARVDVAPVYRTRTAREGTREVRAALRQGRVDVITFASSSAVTAFARKVRDRRLLRGRGVAVIGPVTAATARRHGFRVRVMPREFTIPALGEAIVRALRSSPSGTPRGW